MPKYLITGSYTVSGIKGVLAEGGTGRRDAVAKLSSSLGGTLESFYFGFGGDDFHVIVNLPSNAAAAAVAMTVQRRRWRQPQDHRASHPRGG